MKPAKKECDPEASGYAGHYGDFSVAWYPKGWHVVCDDGKAVGPFHTSQAAFGAAKDAIDSLIKEEMKCR